jgi:hypothetical protein
MTNQEFYDESIAVAPKLLIYSTHHDRLVQ